MMKTKILLIGFLFLQLASKAQFTLTDSLIAYYPFTGNTNDSSGNNLHGTNNGATLTTDRFGNANSAYEFDGIDDFIDLGNSPLFDITSPELTISAWVYKADTNEPIVFLTRRSGSIQYQATWMMNTHPNNPSQIRLNLTGDINNGTAHILQDSWHFIAITYDGDSVRFYFDGVSDGVVHTTGNLSSVNVNTMIGTDNVGNFSKGKIDNVRLYNRPLDKGEIETLYNGPEVTNISTLNETNELRAFPNPVDKILNIIWDDYNDGKIIIRNSLGQQVYSKNLTDIQTQIDCSNYDKGFYFLTLKSTDSNLTRKLIVK